LLAAIDPVNQIERLQPVTNDLPSRGFRLAEIFQKSSGHWAVIDRGPAKGSFSFHWTT
jgi:hypothetical protein